MLYNAEAGKYSPVLNIFVNSELLGMQGYINLGHSWHFFAIHSQLQPGSLIFAIVSLLVLAVLSLNPESHNHHHRLQ